ncbi:hypothetical protein BJ878DRAFT_540952 [Calycina marina]|uniref:Uncharacterized protein n=1 Tax=Calycina marina TaxID=1763456 RepID=A0A9P7Z5F9_9HELO|nr:hypothetical protein BJ878DRAFT_540952 [Calycina marina]
MAQPSASALPTNGFGQKPLITPEQLRELLEYEKIVKFRDTVFAGTHPTVKLPQVPERQASLAQAAVSPSHSTPNRDAPMQRPVSGTHREDGILHHNNGAHSNNSSRTAVAGKGQLPRSEINPILLEKSQDLIKAETQLQRQRLERALREDIEKVRLREKAKAQASESLPDFDLAWVLSRALEIVYPSISTDAPSDASASDSFDEKTFYSSQHDTPELRSPLQAQRGAVAEKAHRSISCEQRQGEDFSSRPQHQGNAMRTGVVHIEDESIATLSQGQTYPSGPRNNISASQPKAIYVPDSGSLQDVNQRPVVNMGREPIAPKFKGVIKAFEETETPVIRAHDLSPIAPQPARVTPLATARDVPLLRENNTVEDVVPAQVAALRQQASGESSANSSPRRPTRPEYVKASKGKRAKKDTAKKRKSPVNVMETRPDSPYIKREPGSPSPFAVAPLPRPNKRKRQHAPELNYDEPVQVVHEPTAEKYKDLPPTILYEDRYAPEPRRPEPVYHRLEPEVGSYRRVPSVQYVEDDGYRRVASRAYSRMPKSPSLYTLPYAPEPRTFGAMPRAVADNKVYEEPVYYQERAPRASVRPDVDHERSRSPIMRERRSQIPMGPPRRPIRIIIDEHGREYIDPSPPPPPVPRFSVAPQPRYREQDVVYERAPTRAVSSRAPVDTYEDDGVLYRRQSPPPPIVRRVVTQPEYGSALEHRSYREREYSARPISPPGEEYVQLRGREQRQMSHFEEAQREYMPRAMSVRPEAIPVRYEIPREREFVGRMQSVRPEGAPIREYARTGGVPSREYAASVRHEGRREVVQSQREYSVRPSEVRESVLRRRDEVPDGERFHGEAPIRRPAEVTYIDRPRLREGSVIVYGDDRREIVYR